MRDDLEKENLSFAGGAKKPEKEAEDAPNQDPISRGLHKIESGLQSAVTSGLMSLDNPGPGTKSSSDTEEEESELDPEEAEIVRGEPMLAAAQRPQSALQRDSLGSVPAPCDWKSTPIEGWNGSDSLKK